MLFHNLLIVYRNFKRYKSTFFINLAGLSTGLACALLIYLWIHDELGFDKFHEKDNQLFQVMLNKQHSGNLETSTSTQALLAEALAQEMPEVEYSVATAGGGNEFTLSSGDHHILATGLLAEKDFFNIFSFALLRGNKSDVLADKQSVVISESTAIALFNTIENVVGNVIEWQFPYGKRDAVISGIFKDLPVNSSMQFDFVLPFSIYKELVGKETLHWGNYGCNTFVVLRNGTNLHDFNNKIAGFISSRADWSNVTPFLKPYSDHYLFGKYENGVQTGGRIEYVVLFSVIAIFILVIACINFMNLSTAKASRRLKEVGIKKAIGAHRRTLITQYLGESVSMALISLAIAFLIADLLLPQFNDVTGKRLSLQFDTTLYLSFLSVTVITGLIAGSYPAFYLSGFSPAKVLKGKINNSIGELWARKGLVVFQFSLSVVFIVAVLVVYKQIEYVQTKHLGYDKDNILYFKPQGKATENLETFLSEIRKIPGVINASTMAHNLVGAQNSTTGYFHWEGKDPDVIIPFEILNVNYDMIETLGIEIEQGRGFSRDFGTDTAALVFNEAAIDIMGFKDPVGKTFNLWGKDMKIIGVARDFHFESLHETVKPLFFRLSPGEAVKVMVRIEPGKERETVKNLETFHHQYNPGYSFDYKFLDQDYQAQYAAEKRVAILSKYFAGLAILISCLGLFGLAAFTAERRLKEIGIRKILGSSEFDIIFLLTSDFTKIVLAAIIIAVPASYLMAQYWLDSFAFRIGLSWWYFAGAGLAALLIAWLTVGTHAIRAARVNPSQCLKDE